MVERQPESLGGPGTAHPTREPTELEFSGGLGTAHPTRATRPVVTPNAYTGDSSWTDWADHFRAVAKVSSWDDSIKLNWLPVRLTGKAQTAWKRLSDETKGDFQAAMDALLRQQRPETLEEAVSCTLEMESYALLRIEEPTRVAAVQEEEQENVFDVCNVRVQPGVLYYPREKQQRRKKNRKRRNCICAPNSPNIVDRYWSCSQPFGKGTVDETWWCKVYNGTMERGDVESLRWTDAYSCLQSGSSWLTTVDLCPTCVSSGTETRCSRVLLTSPDGVSTMYDLGVLADDVTLPLIRSLPPDETHTSVPIGISDLD
ncbi:hypothetical protein EMCRGX_G010684 [Ephydatia muelleri]